MKKLKFIAMAFACLLLASCMGDGYADSEGSKSYSGPAVGNNRLEATNVITIAQLKEKFNSAISNSSYKQITDDIKILGIVTGNDIGGNLYQQISLQDETGGILVKINKSGLYGELPVGQHVLIDCKNLYIGGYGKQAQLGGVYTNTSKNTLGIGTMDRYTWEQHYKIIGEADPAEAEAMVEVLDAAKVKNLDSDYLAQRTGKLIRIEGVTFTKGDGKTVYAEYDGDGVSSIKQYFTGISNNFMAYTSSAAKFAKDPLPTTPVNVTAILTRYNNYWQLIIRTIDDVQDAKGTEQQPYTVTEAIQLMNDGKASDSKVYTTGIICSDPSVATNYGNADYYISVDGKEYKTIDGNYDPAKTIKVFRGYYLNGDKFTDENKDKIKKGQKVLIYGQHLLYNGVTPEINSGNYLVSIQ